MTTISGINLQVTVVLLLALALRLASAATYNVGDGSGWDTNVNYNSWVSTKTFIVGDQLIFTYSSQHSVLEVTSGEYSSCSTSNPIGRNTVSPTTLTLNSTGEKYFICGTAGHCSQGMKLALNVSAANTTSSPSPPGAANSSPPPPGSTTSSPPPPQSPNAAGGLHVPRIDVVMAFAYCLVGVFLWQG